MKAGTGYSRLVVTIGILGFLAISASDVSAAETENILSSIEEAQIQPIGDGTEKYLLKSEGFYCLNEDGTKSEEEGVHYFDHVNIDGTVLNGFYYHDESGKFRAEGAHVVRIKKLTCMDQEFDGLYMVNNLGKLTSAPQVRYIDNLTVENVAYNGYYFFDSNGKMDTEPGYHSLEMTSNGQHFSGTYYFGGEHGVLTQEEGITPEGLPVDETGKVADEDELGMDTLEPFLESMTADYDGEWGIYVKDLNTGEEILLNNTPMYSASLIKSFVMAKTYQDMDQVLENQAKLMNAQADDPAVRKKVDDLLWNMITVSDNESCNELGRLQSENHDFLEGAEAVNEYLEEEGYEDTSYQSILLPSSSAEQSLGGHNTTTVKDCGILLERIVKGECVSEEASGEMLDLLLNQQNTTKIPSGIGEEVQVANKTGETTSDQHDMAVVYGPKTTYILCVMSEGWKNSDEAISHIREISGVVYHYLNL
ncbi:MAG TPA: class A beta-lactamase-related serine hydrolase [Candidatus Blautia excrementipullorum]|nr:class A beta-lactamase-related serine hydrolase [Candidatus Blautia excrementipullorum]